MSSGAASSLASEMMLSSVSDLLTVWKPAGAGGADASRREGCGGAIATESSGSLLLNVLDTALTVALAADLIGAS